MLQDRAEIQNMVVVRYWSLVDLSRLYELAEHETSSNEPQLSEFDRIEHPGGDARLSIEPAPRDNKDDQSKALVKYQETPLNQLNDQMTKAMTRADHLLHAPKDDIVDQLLDEWTRLRHIQARHQPRRHRYGPHYETDTSDLSSSDFQGAKREKGYYLENGNKSNGTHQNIKNVRFRARVESDSSDSGSARGVPRGKKYARRHVLHSDESTTSNESDTSDTDSPPPRSRRSSDTTTAMNTATNSKYRGPMNGRAGDGNGGDRPRRPYTSGDGARPVSRGSAASPIPQQAQPGQQQYPPYQPIRGATMPNPSHGQWLGGSGSQAPPSPGLRPPSQGGYYPQQQQQQPPQQLRRTPSYGVPQQQQQMAPSSPHLNPYIPRPPSQQLPTGFSTDRSLQPPPPHHHHSHPHHQQQLYRQQPSEEDRLREKEERRQRRREKERQKEIAKARKKAGLDEKGGIKQKAKKGLIGAGAVAGLMDILQGLDGL